jgi:hypothetical protein
MSILFIRRKANSHANNNEKKIYTADAVMDVMKENNIATPETMFDTMGRYNS